MKLTTGEAAVRQRMAARSEPKNLIIIVGTDVKVQIPLSDGDTVWSTEFYPSVFI
jgi:hypothetical protein